MALRDIFKLTRKTFVDPVGWIGYSSIKAQNQTIISTLKALFTLPTPTRTETFEQAVERLKLTEEDLKNTARQYRLYASIFFILGLLVFFYSFYLLVRYFAILDLLLGVGATGLFFGQAFRFDFWSLQIRKRKLGLTFNDWKQSILGNSQGPNP